MKMLMAEQWREFERLALRPDAPEIQRTDMRRAFYAGAEAILFKVIQSFAPESEPTDEDLELMQNVHDELQQFARDVKEGRT